jgi:hypothetical protein
LLLFIDFIGLDLLLNNFFFFFAVLRLELRAYTLSHSTSPIFVKGFQDRVLQNYLPRLASNCDPPEICPLRS